MNLPEGFNLLREPALLIAALLAPAVQTALLVWGGLSPGGQAVWNAVAAAVAGLVMAILAAQDRLAPAILGLATAVLALAAWYGWHLDARQQTEILSLVSLATGLFLRTQITAPVAADGRRVPTPTRKDDEPLWPYVYDQPVDPAVDDQAERVEDERRYDTAEIPVAYADDAGEPSSQPAQVARPVELPEVQPARTVAPIEGRRMSG